eukprot:CAMPEP_0178673796 /NCGR_PEP_ID=MMETSP0698-20121128/34493_1 /TAXON_ID=265572 /ORGANISM="Extubocellulus spinifer, Strain CCMP396" /LENGTH=347 /DNA_ID=CAMNT_0020317831 /DNA_START=16 /DNA_END=1060 /DNA_ORIENTATION=+
MTKKKGFINDADGMKDVHDLTIPPAHENSFCSATSDSSGGSSLCGACGGDIEEGRNDDVIPPPPPPPPPPPSPSTSSRSARNATAAAHISLPPAVAAIAGGTAAAIAAGRRNGTTEEGAAAASAFRDDFAGPDKDDFAGPSKGGSIFGSDDNSSDYQIPSTADPMADSSDDGSGDLQAGVGLPGGQQSPPVYDAPPPSPSCDAAPQWSDDDMGWTDLSSDQRQAATFLGYTPQSWDDDENGASTTALSQQYDDMYWTDLSAQQQLALTYLGYNSGSYEDFYADYDFAELPPDVQDAADALGYDREVWDNCVAVVCADVDNMMWDDMSDEEQRLAAVLGYDCWTWNNA